MGWLEIIALRSTESQRIEAALEFLRQFSEAELAAAPVLAHIYRSSLVESDLSIHLFWKSRNTAADKSPLGSRLAHQLRDFGFVNHSIWIEESPELGETA